MAISTWLVYPRKCAGTTGTDQQPPRAHRHDPDRDADDIVGLDGDRAPPALRAGGDHQEDDDDQGDGRDGHAYNDKTETLNLTKLTIDKNLIEMEFLLTLAEAFSSFYGYCFSAPPTSPDCMVFSSFYGDGKLWRRGDKSWTEIDTGPTYRNPVANPVFHNGCFYCLDQQINLGVFQPNGGEDGVIDRGNNDHEEVEARALGCNFRLLEAPEWIKARTDFDINGNDRVNRLFLIESSGELFIVVLDDVKETITVYGVDPDKRQWTRVDDLGDHIFFVGALSCISAEDTAVTKSQIYLQRIQQQACAYYSMDSRQMHLTDDDEVQGHDPHSWKSVWYQTLHYPTSVWIKPQWHQ